jgi:hypothetical protein
MIGRIGAHSAAVFVNIGVPRGLVTVPDATVTISGKVLGDGSIEAECIQY